MSSHSVAQHIQQPKVIHNTATATELRVKIKRYAPTDEAPLPAIFSKGWPRNIYPYGRRECQSEQSQIVDMRVIRIANQYIEVDVLPEYGGHVWGARDLLTNRQMFHRTDVLKHQELGVAGPWLSTGIEFNFPVSHSILTIADVNSVYGVSPDGTAWTRIGATDKLFGLQWQITLALRPAVRALDIAGWLHNPTELEHPYWYWDNAAITVDESLRLYYPFRWSMHHGGQYFRWPGEGDQDMSYWRNCKQPISAFGDSGDKRYFGAYYEKEQYGIVHTADPKVLPGKKYFAWGNGPTGERWAKLLFENLREYVELQAGARNDQEYWSHMPPHSTLWLTERWQPLDALAGISDANELLTVHVFQDKGQAIVRAQSTEELKAVKFRAYTDQAQLAQWTADLHPAQVFSKTLDYRGPVKLEVDPGRQPEMVLRTCDFSISDPGPKPSTRVEEADPAGCDAVAFRKVALHATQVSNWSDAKLCYETAQKLDRTDASLKEEVGLFRLRCNEFAQAKRLLLAAFKAGRRTKAIFFGLLKTAWETDDRKLEQVVLAKITEDADLAHILAHLRHHEVDAAVARAAPLTLQTLLQNRDLAVAVRVARRLGGVPDRELSSVLDDQFPLDPVVRFEADDGSLTRLLKTDPEAGLIVAETYLNYADPQSALKAIELAAQARGRWQLSDLVLAAYCARRAGRSDARQYLEREVDFDPLSDRPWQDVFFRALPEALRVRPDDVRLLLLWGNLLQKCGRTREAAKVWRKALDKGGDWPSLHLSLAIIDWNHRQCSDAEIRKLGKIVARVNHPAYYDHYYSILRHSGQRARLLKEYQRQLGRMAKLQKEGAHKQRRYGTYLQLAYALELHAQGKYDATIDYLKKTTFPAIHGSMALTMAHIHARCERARQALRAKKYAAARKDLERCLEVQHNFNEDIQVLHCLAEAYCLLGDLEAAQGNSDKAREYYDKAAHEKGHDPRQPMAIWRAMGLIKSGKGEEGRKILKNTERLIRNRLSLEHDFHGHYYYLNAVLCCARGERGACERLLKKARKVGWHGGDWGFRF